jgi:hypothetical protein
MLIRLKVSLMALKLASVVGVATSIAWALSDQMGKKLWRLFLWIFFGRESLAPIPSCHTPLPPVWIGA